MTSTKCKSDGRLTITSTPLDSRPNTIDGRAISAITSTQKSISHLREPLSTDRRRRMRRLHLATNTAVEWQCPPVTWHGFDISSKQFPATSFAPTQRLSRHPRHLQRTGQSRGPVYGHMDEACTTHQMALIDTDLQLLLCRSGYEKAQQVAAARVGLDLKGVQRNPM